MKKVKKAKKYRHYIPYPCKMCGKRRWTFKHDRANDQICTVCIRNKVPDNQLTLI